MNTDPNNKIEQGIPEIGSEATTTAVPVNPPEVPVNPPEEKKEEVKEEDTISPIEDPDSKKSITNLFMTDAKQEQKIVVMSKKKAEELAAEKRKVREEKEHYEAKPVSGFKYFLMIVFLLAMGGFVFFLPDISKYIAIKKAEKDALNTPKIQTGRLECKSSKTTDKYNIDFTAIFYFTDNELKKLVHTTITRGDSIKDYEDLQNMNAQCIALRGDANKFEGVVVSCELDGGTNTERDSFDYKRMEDVSKVIETFKNHDALYPDFKLDQNIDKIEADMTATNYTCERVATE